MPSVYVCMIASVVVCVCSKSRACGWAALHTHGLPNHGPRHSYLPHPPCPPTGAHSCMCLCDSPCTCSTPGPPLSVCRSTRSAPSPVSAPPKSYQCDPSPALPSNAQAGWPACNEYPSGAQWACHIQLPLLHLPVFGASLHAMGAVTSRPPQPLASHAALPVLLSFFAEMFENFLNSLPCRVHRGREDVQGGRLGRDDLPQASPAHPCGMARSAAPSVVWSYICGQISHRRRGRRPGLLPSSIFHLTMFKFR